MLVIIMSICTLNPHFQQGMWVRGKRDRGTRRWGDKVTWGRRDREERRTGEVDARRETMDEQEEDREKRRKRETETRRRAESSKE